MNFVDTIGNATCLLAVFSFLTFGIDRLWFRGPRLSPTATAHTLEQNPPSNSPQPTSNRTNPGTDYLEWLCLTCTGGTVRLFYWSQFGKTPAERARNLLMFQRYQVKVLLVQGDRSLTLYSPDHEDPVRNHALVCGKLSVLEENL